MRKAIAEVRKLIAFLYRRYTWIRQLDRFRTSIWGLKQNLIFSYPHRIVFIAGMAKSGSSWVQRMLLNIPGYQRSPIVDRSNITKGKVWDESYFTNIPKFGYYVLKTHAEASTELLANIRKMNLLTIVTYRDLRDQSVSRYYHQLVDPNSVFYKMYHELPENEAFSHSVDLTLDYYLPWIEDWLKVIQKNPDQFLLFSYEDLLDDPESIFREILRFYNIDLSNQQIKEALVVADAMSRGGVDTLAERIQVGGGANFRGGRKGDWRSHFSERDVEVFKKRAGEHLIRLGYEKDMNWGI